MVEAATLHAHRSDPRAEEYKMGEPTAPDHVSVVNNLARQEVMGLPQNSQTSARVVLQTTQGLINRDVVREMMQNNI